MIAQPERKAVPFASVQKMVERYEGIAKAKARAQEFTEKARSLVLSFPESPYQRALLAVTDLVTERDH